MAWSRIALLPFVYSSVVIATTPLGNYLGNTSIDGLTQYLGIRYARPPVGDLRFAPPQPWQSLDDAIVDATAYGPGCPQLPGFELYNGLSEDCLTLNIVAPSCADTESSLLPVMFFIHGGGNYNGQSIFYNGTALVQHSVEIGKPTIYVGFNYRLGGFGFLTSPEFNDAGLSNLGLMDQRLALQWVHDNIAEFGGDLEKVTIFGESAGAANCWAQSHFAHTQGDDEKYFRAMITQSGAPGSPSFPAAVNPSDGIESYDRLLEGTNCTGSTDKIACLRAVPYDAIAPILINGSIADFTIDDVWFKESFLELLEAEEYLKIPTVHGANLDEGSAFMPDVFNFPNTSELVATIASYLENNLNLAATVIAAYNNVSLVDLGKGYNADPTAPDDFYHAMAVYSDTWMHLGRRAWLRKASQTQPTWGYVFEQQPPLSTLNLSYEYPGFSEDYYRRLGVYHGAELPYVFGEVSSVANHTDGDVHLASKMMSWWITFAHELNPNCDNESIYWARYNTTADGTLMFLQEQGGRSVTSGGDTMRQTVYDAWNSARSAIQLSEPY
ncbi:Alpha/Beta hydrolase protein [Paraphoma chrysanthemicola]|uniref:Carboxylic ester hydrolase n=1 Tax=Paraphoma chrysanthemicola TaxID=798071 RepID=A0A8K0VZ05_9PLEO|nr:Alpha/Beta hydrolase protein [Paraphoma chrysanthemicola]